MVGYLGVTGQPGDVEPEVGKLGPAIPRPAAIPQGPEQGFSNEYNIPTNAILCGRAVGLPH
jgi:hypothetical protein